MSTPVKWGKEPNTFIYELKDKVVLVSLVNGKTFKGELIGADPYNICLRQSTGLELMISKGQMVYIHVAGSGK